MTVHTLKTWPAYFGPVVDGRKTFEIRFNDRGYQAGDVAHLAEYDASRPCDCAPGQHHRYDVPAGLRCRRFTGREYSAEITYVLATTPGVGSRAGFDGRGYVVLGLAPRPLRGGEIDQRTPPRPAPPTGGRIPVPSDLR